MWPSTWALSVETWERPNHHRRIPRNSRLSRMTLMIEKTSLRERLGVGFVTDGRGLASVLGSVAVGSIVVAIVPSSLMQGVRAAHGARQRDPRHQRRETRIDVRFTRANQRLLSIDHFDIPRDAGLEALPCLRDFLGRQAQPLARDHLLGRRRPEIEQR